ncbi:MAG: hypothetical protein KGQ40_07490 [Rhodospirillales bacterium]|nr:hypothetical protein [Rhodospirillales bacterium]
MSWDGHEAPDTRALLEIARTTLMEAVIPALTGDARFKALMVANAMAIARREDGPAAAAVHAAVRELGDVAALCAAIRAGAHDPGSADHDRIAASLRALAEARCRISAPKALG